VSTFNIVSARSVEFGGKEAYMEKLNEFIHMNKQKLSDYYADLKVGFAVLMYQLFFYMQELDTLFALFKRLSSYHINVIGSAQPARGWTTSHCTACADQTLGSWRDASSATHRDQCSVQASAREQGQQT